MTVSSPAIELEWRRFRPVSRSLLRVPVTLLREGEIALDPDTSHYLCAVHRLSEGTDFVAFDPSAAAEADARLTRASPREALCIAGPVRDSSRVPVRSVALLQAVAKPDKLDRVIADATALGVDRVVFVETERVQIRLGSRAEKRRDRWQSIAVQAARQSGRGNVPEIAGPVSLAEALADRGTSSRVGLALSPSAERSLSDLMDDIDPSAALSILIGPEGGLTDGELASARAAGFQLVGLGSFTLRTELAAAAALGAVAARVAPLSPAS